MHSGSSISAQEQLAALEARLNAILPPRYVGCFEDVSPQSMGTAKLKYDKDGKVSWGEIWTSFCDLAMAGGPPHRGHLLNGISSQSALAQPAEQAAVVAEIKRGIFLAAALSTTETAPPGWVGVRCEDQDVAAWLVRAIVAENVIAWHEGNVLYVPAGPNFRVEKEIKNVIVCVAKSSHYLLDHVDSEARPRGLADNLVQPPTPDELAAHAAEIRRAADQMRETLSNDTGLAATLSAAGDWIGIGCSSEEMAVWMQRAIIVENVLARRELNTLYVPVPFTSQLPQAVQKIQEVVAQAKQLWMLSSNASGEHN